VGSLTEDVDLGRSRYDVAAQVDRRVRSRSMG